jgi:ABC-type sugar transport system permease subunit
MARDKKDLNTRHTEPQAPANASHPPRPHLSTNFMNYRSGPDFSDSKVGKVVLWIIGVVAAVVIIAIFIYLVILLTAPGNSKEWANVVARMMFFLICAIIFIVVALIKYRRDNQEFKRELAELDEKKD